MKELRPCEGSRSVERKRDRTRVLPPAPAGHLDAGTGRDGNERPQPASRITGRIASAYGERRRWWYRNNLGYSVNGMRNRTELVMRKKQRAALANNSGAQSTTPCISFAEPRRTLPKHANAGTKYPGKLSGTKKGSPESRVGIKKNIFRFKHV